MMVHHVCMYVCTQRNKTQTQTQTHTQHTTHTQIQTHTHIHTHTQIHTHTESWSDQWSDHIIFAHSSLMSIPHRGLQKKIKIKPGSKDKNRLPIGHTCFNTLELPDYRNKYVLRSKVCWRVYVCMYCMYVCVCVCVCVCPIPSQIKNVRCCTY